jgi:hypothetical protein
MLNRRSLIGAAAIVPLIGIGEARATTLADYVVHRGSEGTAENTPTGIRLRGGRYDDFASGVRFFSRVILPSSGTARYRLMREIVPDVVSKNGVWFNVGIVWGRDPSLLPADTPTGDVAVAPLWNGFRITHANRDPPASGISDRIRLRTYPSRMAIAPREQKVSADFRLGVPYEVVLTWGGPVVALVVPALGAEQSFAADALRVPETGARLMFYASFGGGFLIEDVRLSQASTARSSDTTPAVEGTAAIVGPL